jgi:hypothetical protein
MAGWRIPPLPHRILRRCRHQPPSLQTTRGFAEKNPVATGRETPSGMRLTHRYSNLARKSSSSSMFCFQCENPLWEFSNTMFNHQRVPCKIDRNSELVIEVAMARYDCPQKSQLLQIILKISKHDLGSTWVAIFVRHTHVALSKVVYCQFFGGWIDIVFKPGQSCGWLWLVWFQICFFGSRLIEGVFDGEIHSTLRPCVSVFVGERTLFDVFHSFPFYVGWYPHSRELFSAVLFVFPCCLRTEQHSCSNSVDCGGNPKIHCWASFSVIFKRT